MEHLKFKYYTASVFLPYLSGKQIASFLSRIMLSSVAYLALRYFSILSHKRQDFRKKNWTHCMTLPTSKYLSLYEQFSEIWS